MKPRRKGQGVPPPTPKWRGQPTPTAPPHHHPGQYYSGPTRGYEMRGSHYSAPAPYHNEYHGEHYGGYHGGGYYGGYNEPYNTDAAPAPAPAPAPVPAPGPAPAPAPVSGPSSRKIRVLDDPEFTTTVLPSGLDSQKSRRLLRFDTVPRGGPCSDVIKTLLDITTGALVSIMTSSLPDDTPVSDHVTFTNPLQFLPFTTPSASRADIMDVAGSAFQVAVSPGVELKAVAEAIVRSIGGPLEHPGGARMSIASYDSVVAPEADLDITRVGDGSSDQLMIRIAGIPVIQLTPEQDVLCSRGTTRSSVDTGAGAGSGGQKDIPAMQNETATMRVYHRPLGVVATGHVRVIPAEQCVEIIGHNWSMTHLCDSDGSIIPTEDVSVVRPADACVSILERLAARHTVSRPGEEETFEAKLSNFVKTSSVRGTWGSRTQTKEDNTRLLHQVTSLKKAIASIDETSQKEKSELQARLAEATAKTKTLSDSLLEAQEKERTTREQAAHADDTEKALEKERDRAASLEAQLFATLVAETERIEKISDEFLELQEKERTAREQAAHANDTKQALETERDRVASLEAELEKERALHAATKEMLKESKATRKDLRKEVVALQKAAQKAAEVVDEVAVPPKDDGDDGGVSKTRIIELKSQLGRYKEDARRQKETASKARALMMEEVGNAESRVEATMKTLFDTEKELQDVRLELDDMRRRLEDASKVRAGCTPETCEVAIAAKKEADQRLGAARRSLLRVLSLPAFPAGEASAVSAGVTSKAFKAVRKSVGFPGGMSDIEVDVGIIRDAMKGAVSALKEPSIAPQSAGAKKRVQSDSLMVTFYQAKMYLALLVCDPNSQAQRNKLKTMFVTDDEQLHRMFYQMLSGGIGEKRRLLAEDLGLDLDSINDLTPAQTMMMMSGISTLIMLDAAFETVNSRGITSAHDAMAVIRGSILCGYRCGFEVNAETLLSRERTASPKATLVPSRVPMHCSFCPLDSGLPPELLPTGIAVDPATTSLDSEGTGVASVSGLVSPLSMVERNRGAVAAGCAGEVLRQMLQNVGGVFAGVVHKASVSHYEDVTLLGAMTKAALSPAVRSCAVLSTIQDALTSSLRAINGPVGDVLPKAWSFDPVAFQTHLASLGPSGPSTKPVELASVHLDTATRDPSTAVKDMTNEVQRAQDAIKRVQGEMHKHMDSLVKAVKPVELADAATVDQEMYMVYGVHDQLGGRGTNFSLDITKHTLGEADPSGITGVLTSVSKIIDVGSQSQPKGDEDIEVEVGWSDIDVDDCPPIDDRSDSDGDGDGGGVEETKGDPGDSVATTVADLTFENTAWMGALQEPHGPGPWELLSTGLDDERGQPVGPAETLVGTCGEHDDDDDDVKDTITTLMKLMGGQPSTTDADTVSLMETINAIDSGIEKAKQNKS